MQTAALARGILSVCLSVCLSVRPSVIFRCFVQTNEDTTVRLLLESGRTIILVSEEEKFIRIFVREALALSLAKISPIIGHNLETVQDRRCITINH